MCASFDIPGGGAPVRSVQIATLWLMPIRSNIQQDGTRKGFFCEAFFLEKTMVCVIQGVWVNAHEHGDEDERS